MTAKDSSGIAGIFFCLWRRLLCHRIVTVIVHAWFLATDRALWALVRLRGYAGQPKQGTGYEFFFLLFVLRVLARRVLSSSCSAYDRSLSRDEGKSLTKPGATFFLPLDITLLFTRCCPTPRRLSMYFALAAQELPFLASPSDILSRHRRPPTTSIHCDFHLADLGWISGM